MPTTWPVVVIASKLRDQRVFDAASQVIVDRSAPEMLRAAGIVVLAAQAGNDLGYFSGDSVRWGPTLFTVPLHPVGLCAPASGFLHREEGAQPLGPDHKRDAAKILDPIAVDSSESALISRLAECARPASIEVPPQIDVSSVELTYQCGNRFLVSNPTQRNLPFRYEIHDTGERVRFIVLAHSEKRLVPGTVGTMMLYYDGQPVASAANTGSPCPP